MLLSEFHDKIAEFLLSLRAEKNLSDYTYRSYASDLQQLHTFWHTNMPQAHIQEAISKFRAHLNKIKASNSTIARKLSCFNSYEKFLQRQGIELNLLLVRPPVILPAPVTLSPEEISFLLDKTPVAEIKSSYPCRDKAILELLYATGVRCSEIINIRFSHVNMQEQSIIIHGRRKKTRTVFFSKKAQEQLEYYINHERKKAENANEFLFLNYRSQPLTSRSIQRICNMFGTILPSQKTITPHILRHSFAAHLLEQGAEPKTVQQLLGFSTTTSIEKYLC